jgi:hypothetical protein
MTVRISATETTTSNGGTVNVQAYFQTGAGFTFQSPGTDLLPIDGQFHDLEFSLTGLTDMNVIDLTGINLGSHTAELRINVDNISFAVVPEPPSVILLLGGILGLGLAGRRNKRSV